MSWKSRLADIYARKWAIPKEEEAWRLVKDSESLEDLRDFLALFPEGRLTRVAQLKLRQLERVQQAEQA